MIELTDCYINVSKKEKKEKDNSAKVHLEIVILKISR